MRDLPGTPFEKGSPMDGHRVIHEDDLRAFAASVWREGKDSPHDPNCRLNAEPDDCICANPYAAEEPTP